MDKFFFRFFFLQGKETCSTGGHPSLVSGVLFCLFFFDRCVLSAFLGPRCENSYSSLHISFRCVNASDMQCAHLSLIFTNSIQAESFVSYCNCNHRYLSDMIASDNLKRVYFAICCRFASCCPLANYFRFFFFFFGKRRVDDLR